MTYVPGDYEKLQVELAGAVDAKQRMSRELEELRIQKLALQMQIEEAVQEREQARADLASTKERLKEAQNKHLIDIERIDQALTDAAERNDWCDEFEDEIEKLNVNLTYKLTPRSREYEVTVPWEITITGSTIVNVTAQDETQARVYAEENLDVDVARAASDNAFDADLTVTGIRSEWEVEW